jgi:putative ABC transport system permease protein
VSQKQVAGSIQRVVPRGSEVLTGEAITKESQSDLKNQLSFITIFLLVFAIVALFVGTFVIYNSFSIIVAQRAREMALMRAIGASRRQVRRAVFVEGARHRPRLARLRASERPSSPPGGPAAWTSSTR